MSTKTTPTIAKTHEGKLPLAAEVLDSCAGATLGKLAVGTLVDGSWEVNELCCNEGCQEVGTAELGA